MEYLEFEEKLQIKKSVEKKIYLDEKKKEKINLLKGSLDNEQKKAVEDLLKNVKYYYESDRKIKEAEAKCYYIGKAIVILTDDKRKILNFISLEDFDSGINEYKEITGELYRDQTEQNNEIREELNKLVVKFLNLGKGNRIEKGRLLTEMDNILSKNKHLSKVKDILERLNITGQDKYMFIKRYKLFLEFENSELFGEDKSYMETIDDMTNDELRDITKKHLTFEKKEEFLLSLI